MDDTFNLTNGKIDENILNVICGEIKNLPIKCSSVNYVCILGVVGYSGTNGMGADIWKITKTETTIKCGNIYNWLGVRFDIRINDL